MNALNAKLTAAMQWLLAPFAGWPPILTLVAWSAVAGVLMAIVFRYTSNQRALGRTADYSRAQVLAIKLFKDDLRTMFASIGQLLRYTGLRLWHSLAPMLVMLVPFVLLLSQLALRYEHRPLAVGQPAVVELRLAEDAWQQFRDAAIQTQGQIAVETGPLRDEREHAIYWRIRPKQAAAATVGWRLGSLPVEKQIAVENARTRLPLVSVRRPGAGWWDRLLHPGEAGFAAGSPVRAVVVHHPSRATPLLGVDVPWWATFLIVSILAAVLVRPLVGVRF